jgi:hypothetical protein
LVLQRQRSGNRATTATSKEPKTRLSLYSWGEAKFIRAKVGSRNEREIPYTLVVRAPIPRLAPLPAIGSSRSAILKEFGVPHAETLETVHYLREDSEAQPQAITFRFNDEGLVEIVCDFGVD